MVAIFLTHAEARAVRQSLFRSLTEQGRVQIDQTACHFREVVGQFTPGIVSSESEIWVRDRLYEQREGQLSPGDVVSVLDDMVLRVGPRGRS